MEREGGPGSQAEGGCRLRCGAEWAGVRAGVTGGDSCSQPPQGLVAALGLAHRPRFLCTWTCRSESFNKLRTGTRGPQALGTNAAGRQAHESSERIGARLSARAAAHVGITSCFLI